METASKTTAPVIKMEAVSVGSLRDLSTIILEGVDWQAAAGDYWVLAGLQGAGKTDFLMMTAGLMPPEAGSYRLFGEPMPIFDEARLPIRLRLGQVFDGGQLFNHLTVFENISLPLRYHRNLSETQAADLTELGKDVAAGRVQALYVFDPGPDGSLGDTKWIVDARRSGAISLLIVQGVLMTDLARAADFVLPGASYVEKEASYTNQTGRLQGTSKAIPLPGEAREDWEILTNLARALGVPFAYTSAGEVRADIVGRFSTITELQGLSTLAFNKPLEARTWLQASNPSERWKWDFMYQDLPPVKGTVDETALPLPPGSIPLKPVRF